MAEVDALDGLVAQFKPESGVARAKWFGKPCIKVGDRVFVVLWGHDLAFKLEGAAHAEGLAVPGAHLFDPRGRGNAMKEWVQIPAGEQAVWPRFAELAYRYVVSLPD